MVTQIGDKNVDPIDDKNVDPIDDKKVDPNRKTKTLHLKTKKRVDPNPCFFIFGRVSNTVWVHGLGSLWVHGLGPRFGSTIWVPN